MNIFTNIFILKYSHIYLEIRTKICYIIVDIGMFDWRYI